MVVLSSGLGYIARMLNLRRGMLRIIGYGMLFQILVAKLVYYFNQGIYFVIEGHKFVHHHHLFCFEYTVSRFKITLLISYLITVEVKLIFKFFKKMWRVLHRNFFCNINVLGELSLYYLLTREKQRPLFFQVRFGNFKRACFYLVHNGFYNGIFALGIIFTFKVAAK